MRYRGCCTAGVNEEPKPKRHSHETWKPHIVPKGIHFERSVMAVWEWDAGKSKWLAVMAGIEGLLRPEKVPTSGWSLLAR